MVKKILLVLVVLIAVFAVVVYFQPEDFAIERLTVIPAAPAAVFPLVNDFQHWNDWSPWDKIDPQMKRTYSNPAAGKGAKYSWVGNKEVGEGDMTITESKPNEQILINLHFIKPMPGNSLTEFKFAPEGNGTKVTWRMSGKNDYLHKAICLVMNMEKMVGGKFEEGLTNLKNKVAASEAAAFQAGVAGLSTPTPSPTAATPTGGPALK